MKQTLLIALGSAALIISATTVNAHDPALHKKENAEKPQCEAMEGMDHSKMDMNDPIMQAMMKQCMGDDNHKGEHETMEKNHGGIHKPRMHKMDEHKDDEHKGDGHHGDMKKPH